MMGWKNGGKGDPGFQRWGKQKARPDYTARVVVRKATSLAGPGNSHHVMVWEVCGGKKTRGFKAVGELGQVGPLGMSHGGCAK